ncbi:TetR/AcrR family transcriptional regulator [Kineococcus sp. SYSU DK003]|uniref:TetR/AcrR family transcriptional regulator n=1 Tax=Kineococcus sp. SYSU DK003 TaxID=3383124 RepID=UPI003D7D23DC
MARWAPGSRDRLQQAAVELFAEQGYEQTTVAQIAERAGVTERTFFRTFADKREVLFAGSEQLEALIVDAVAGSPATDPVDVAADGLDAAAQFFPEDRRPYVQARQELVVANPALAEREQLKMVTLASSVARALRERGVGEPAARLLAHSAITVFQVAFETWVRAGEDRPLQQLQRETFTALRETLGARTAAR